MEGGIHLDADAQEDSEVHRCTPAGTMRVYACCPNAFELILEAGKKG